MKHIYIVAFITLCLASIAQAQYWPTGGAVDCYVSTPHSDRDLPPLHFKAPHTSSEGFRAGDLSIPIPYLPDPEGSYEIYGTENGGTSIILNISDFDIFIYFQGGDSPYFEFDASYNGESVHDNLPLRSTFVTVSDNNGAPEINLGFGDAILNCEPEGCGSAKTKLSEQCTDMSPAG